MLFYKTTLLQYSLKYAKILEIALYNHGEK